MVNLARGEVCNAGDMRLVLLRLLLVGMLGSAEWTRA